MCVCVHRFALLVLFFPSFLHLSWQEFTVQTALGLQYHPFCAAATCMVPSSSSSSCIRFKLPARGRRTLLKRSVIPAHRCTQGYRAVVIVILQGLYSLKTFSFWTVLTALFFPHMEEKCPRTHHFLNSRYISPQAPFSGTFTRLLLSHLKMITVTFFTCPNPLSSV